MPTRTLALLLLSGLSAGACAAAGPPLPEPAAPASEARATFRFRIDLPRAQRCEEAFDLALYQDRGIELVEWDAGSGCVERTISVRYLPRRVSLDDVTRAIGKAGAKITHSEPFK